MYGNKYFFIVLISFVGKSLTQSCKSEEQKCGSFCFNTKNEWCCDYTKVCKLGSDCCISAGRGAKCYEKSTHKCCGMGQMCKTSEQCCLIDCCIEDYYCYNDLSCRLEFYFGFKLIIPMILSILSIVLVIYYMFSNKIFSRINRKTLPTVSNNEIMEGLHSQKPKEQDYEINQRLQEKIINKKFSSRNEFECLIIGELNSFYWISSSFIGFVGIIPIYLGLICKEKLILFIPNILATLLSCFAQIITNLKIGKIRYDKYGYFVLIFIILVGILNLVYSIINLHNDNNRILSRIGVFAISFSTLLFLKNSIKLATNEDKTLFIGEAVSKYYTTDRIDSNYVSRTENITTLKIIVPYPDYLIEK